MTQREKLLSSAATTKPPDRPRSAPAEALPLLLTIPQVMEALQISRRTVYELIRLGKLELARPGVRISRITTESVLALAGASFKPLRIPRLRNQRNEETAESTP